MANENVKVYAIDLIGANIKTHPSNLSIEEFISEAERQGKVWTLLEFQEDFNHDAISDLWYITII